ncbi:MAG: hypothetical protein EBS05_18345 [Proteobacteria bacterium]|nr:hypothetical protein [Pseudomonadota bacterium]
MKAFCIALATLLLVTSAQAQRTGVLSTTTNWLLGITATGKSVIEGTNAASIRTLLSITNATGLEATAADLVTVSNTVTAHGNTLATYVALLNGTNVLIGTNRFAGTVLITNAASTISGNGAGLTNLAAGNIATGSLADARLSTNVALLGATNQNWAGTNSFPRGTVRGLSQFVYYYVSNAVVLTNLGVQAPMTNGATWNSASNDTVAFVMRPLESPNATLIYSYMVRKSSTTNTGSTINVYVGNATNTCTNLIQQSGIMSGTAIRANLFNGAAGGVLIGTYTNLALIGGTMFPTTTNVVYTATDFSLPWILAIRGCNQSSDPTCTMTFDQLAVGAFIP